MKKTQKENRVTFFNKYRLWTKGETSGNYLNVKNIQLDCDNDTLLIQAALMDHLLQDNNLRKDETPKGFIYTLQSTIASRSIITKRFLHQSAPQKGINKVAQKVGEEAVELVIEAKDNSLDLFKNDSRPTLPLPYFA